MLTFLGITAGEELLNPCLLTGSQLMPSGGQLLLIPPLADCWQGALLLCDVKGEGRVSAT